MRRLASVLLASALLTACGDSFSPEGVSGLYILESINGSPLPFSETETQNGLTVTVAITDGSVSLNANSTFSFSLTISITLNGTTTTSTVTDSGTFELVEPSTVRATFSDGDVISGTLDGNRLTVIVEGDSLVFSK